jgi:hypothetical protein
MTVLILPLFRINVKPDVPKVSPENRDSDYTDKV